MTEATEALQARLKAAYAAYLEGMGAEACRGQIPMTYEKCSAEERYLQMRLVVDSPLRNVHNTLHGGLTATLFDTLMGLFTCVYTGCATTTTVEMQQSFLHPVPMGTKLHIRVYMQSFGKSLAHLRCEAFAEDAPDRILAAGTGVYFLFK